MHAWPYLVLFVEVWKSIFTFQVWFFRRNVEVLSFGTLSVTDFFLHPPQGNFMCCKFTIFGCDKNPQISELAAGTEQSLPLSTHNLKEQFPKLQNNEGPFTNFNTLQVVCQLAVSDWKELWWNILDQNVGWLVVVGSQWAEKIWRRGCHSRRRL